MTRARGHTRPRLARATPIDWAAVRRRLDSAAIRDADALTAEQAQAVLAERARALAAALVTEVDRTARLDVLIVRLAGERYALTTEYVWRMVGAADLAPVPGAPHLLLGVMNLHGDVLPVFDPRPLLGLAGELPAGRVRVVVLGTERADLGLVVDAADDVIALRTTQLHAAPDSIPPARRALLRGVMQDGLIVLDGARLLADPRLVVAAPG